MCTVGGAALVLQHIIGSPLQAGASGADPVTVSSKLGVAQLIAHSCLNRFQQMSSKTIATKDPSRPKDLHLVSALATNSNY